MNKPSSAKLTEYSLGQPVPDSVSAPTNGLPETVARLNPGGPCLAKPQDRTTEASASLSTVAVGNGVAATSTQHRQLSPIETVPLELFQVIMWEFVKKSLPRSISKYYRAITRMRLVCRRWTVILEGMPELWAILSPSLDERLIDLALSRSMHRPLTVAGDLVSSPTVDKLFQHTHRWKVLDIHAVDDVTKYRLAVHSAPLLEELRLDPSSPIHPMLLFNGSAPMLRIVHIRNNGAHWNIPVLSNLHELALLDIQTIWRGAPDVNTFLQILSSSPKLTRLQVRNTHFTRSPPSQTRVPLPCLLSLELGGLEQGILEQIVDAVDIPTSTKCSFSVALNLRNYQQLEPIIQRLKALASVSKGSKSTLTLRKHSRGWVHSVRMTYEGEADQHGALTAQVALHSGFATDVLVYFARQLGQSERNPVPPALHIAYDPNEAYTRDENGLLRRLQDHLPGTEEILIEDLSAGLIENALDRLFPKYSSRLFTHLSTLIIRSAMHGEWAGWLQRRQKRHNQPGGVDRLPLQTLKIEGGNISAGKMKGLKRLVPNLVLDGVKIT